MEKKRTNMQIVLLAFQPPEDGGREGEDELVQGFDGRQTDDERAKASSKSHLLFNAGTGSSSEDCSRE